MSLQVRAEDLLIPLGLLEALSQSNAAAVGGVIATIVTYPLDVIKTKLSASDGTKFGNEIQCIRYVLKTQGSEVFLRGLPTKTMWSLVGKFVFYGTYSALNTLYTNTFKGAAGFGAGVGLGYMSELVTVMFSLPFEEISTVMQTTSEGTLGGAISKIWNAHGIAGFYRSLRATFFVAFTPALVTTFFTQLKALFLKGRANQNLGTLESFLIGAIARMLGVMIMFPISRVQTIIQADVKEGEDGKEEGEDGKEKGENGKKAATPTILNILKAIYRQGFFAMYRGLRPTLVRGVISSAVTLMVKERLAIFFRAVLITAFMRKK